MSAENALRRRLLTAYRHAQESNKEMPFLHTRQHLAGQLGEPYEVLAPQVEWLEQNRYLHWKAADVFKISPKGVRATHTADDLAREFPD
ncbi:MAG TPA: hypothetical protein VGK30_12980 [Candidatus Binatia bacterium]|jgi:hypothetical protein